MATKLSILGGLIIVMLGTNMLHAQVGINTTDPKAQLEIKSSNPATPSNKDGILIPKINAFPTTNPTVDQDGMMVFLTTTVGANPKGFYFWDNAATSWKIVSGKPGWNDSGNAGTTPGTNFIGTTDNQDLRFKTNNNDAMTIAADGDIGIGTNTPEPSAQLDINSTSGGVLLPRMTTVQRDAIVNPKEGLVIYNTNLQKFQGYFGNNNIYLEEFAFANTNGGSQSGISGQSFTSNFTGMLVSFRIGFGTSQFTTIRLYDSGVPTGTPIHTQSINTIGLTWNPVTLSVPIPIITGRVYSISIDNGAYFLTRNSNSYPGGSLFDGTTPVLNRDAALGIGVMLPSGWSDLSNDTNPNWTAKGNNASANDFIGTTNATDLIFKTNDLEQARILSNGNIGLNTSTPAALLDIAAGADNNGANDPFALAFQYRSGGYRHWIRTRHNGAADSDGNAIDFYLNNSATANGSSAPTVGTKLVMSLENGVVEQNKAAIGGGNVINKTQHGTLIVGSGTIGSLTKTVTLTFPTAFASVPDVVGTAINDGTLGDKFSVTVTNITTTAATFIVYRLDSAPPPGSVAGWGQNLKLSWWAFE